MTLNIARIKMEQPRETYAAWTTNVQITKVRIEIFSFPIKKFDFLDVAEKHGIAVAVMVSRLSLIHGIDSVTVQSNRVSVHMHDLFQITHQIEKIVTRAILVSAVVQMRNERPVLEIEEFPNDDYRGFNTRIEICSAIFVSFHRPLSFNDSGLVRIGMIGRALVKKLLKIEGVVEVNIRPYGLNVEKASTYSWEEIEPSVIEVFAQVLGELKITRKK